MTKVLAGTLGLGVLLALHVAYADDPKDKKDQPPQAGEKADTSDNLEKVTPAGERPWAAGVSADQQKTALAKFREANELLNSGLFGRAAETYKEALKSWKHPAIHYNLALALMNLDQPIEAYENMQQATVYGEGPLDKDKLEHAKEYLLLLEKQIANVQVSCDKVGAKVSLDGKEVFVGPGTYKAKVRIGKHTFVAEKTGYSTRINAPFIGPGENFRIELKLYTAEELTRYNRRWQATWFPYAVLGAGVVLAGVGAFMENQANSAYADYDAAVADCNKMNPVANGGCATTSNITSMRDSGDSKKTLGYVMYGAAGLTIGAGIVLAIMNRQQPYQIRPEDLQDQTKPGAVAISPVLSPSMAGAMVHGSF
jgi:tetratricopeptide (TPR) repeat protein